MQVRIRGVLFSRHISYSLTERLTLSRTDCDLGVLGSDKNADIHHCVSEQPGQCSLMHPLFFLCFYFLAQAVQYTVVGCAKMEITIFPKQRVSYSRKNCFTVQKIQKTHTK